MSTLCIRRKLNNKYIYIYICICVRFELAEKSWVLCPIITSFQEKAMQLFIVANRHTHGPGI